MLTPRITRCADGHFRRVIYGLGPYIADYPEQVLLACVVNGWCPRYVIYVYPHLLQAILMNSVSCTAPADDLDSPTAGRRSHKHTATAMDVASLDELWDNYGIIGDIIV